MTRAELIDEVVKLYFEGNHLHEAIQKVKGRIKGEVKQVARLDNDFELMFRKWGIERDGTDGTETESAGK